MNQLVCQDFEGYCQTLNCIFLTFWVQHFIRPRLNRCGLLQCIINEKLEKGSYEETLAT